MKFNIIGPITIQVMEINWIEVKTDCGSFVIQKGHAPLLATVPEKKELTIELKNGSVTTMTSMGGILEVDQENINLLVI